MDIEFIMCKYALILSISFLKSLKYSEKYIYIPWHSWDTYLLLGMVFANILPITFIFWNFLQMCISGCNKEFLKPHNLVGQYNECIVPIYLCIV